MRRCRGSSAWTSSSQGTRMSTRCGEWHCHTYVNLGHARPHTLLDRTLARKVEWDSTPQRRPHLHTRPLHTRPTITLPPLPSTPPPSIHPPHTSHLHTCTQVTKCSSGLQINPGSATGAYSTFSNTVVPSFVLLDLDGSKVGRGGGRRRGRRGGERVWGERRREGQGHGMLRRGQKV